MALFFTLVKVFCQLSSLTIVYSSIVFNYSSLTLFVPISDNCRPTSHNTVLCIFHFSSFLTKYILLVMCLIYLVLLTLLAMHTSDLINVSRDACYGYIYVHLFISSLFRIMKCDRDITEVNT